MASAAGDDNSDDFNTETSGFRPAEKTIQEIVSADADDQSLIKYKQELLGSAAAGGVVIRPDNPEKVIVTNISLISDGEVKRSMDLPGPDDFVLSIKEGCVYHIRIQYYVQREIVIGLRYSHKVKRMAVPVDKETYMFGSFAPREEVYEYTSPAEEAPSGFIQRGKYSVSSAILDDDGHAYLKWNWVLEITKDW
uniref:Rho GDP-dissociation inhibitor 1 n=1 Tax=Panagrolaimus sp. PS1159 TaxID=55785 RepID=A0AC35FL81_9BILA